MQRIRDFRNFEAALIIEKGDEFNRHTFKGERYSYVFIHRDIEIDEEWLTGSISVLGEYYGKIFRYD